MQKEKVDIDEQKIGRNCRHDSLVLKKIKCDDDNDAPADEADKNNYE